MVIDQFHFKSVVIMPDKTYTPLVINADAVLSFFYRLSELPACFREEYGDQAGM